jgi:hypothetical protein
LIPTVLLFGGVMLLALRRREPAASADPENPSDADDDGENR